MTQSAAEIIEDKSPSSEKRHIHTKLAAAATCVVVDVDVDDELLLHCVAIILFSLPTWEATLEGFGALPLLVAFHAHTHQSVLVVLLLKLYHFRFTHSTAVAGVVKSCLLVLLKVWDNKYFVDLLEYDWVTSESPAGNTQWVPTLFANSTETEEDLPDIIMLTSDIALIRVSDYFTLSCLLLNSALCYFGLKSKAAIFTQGRLFITPAPAPALRPTHADASPNYQMRCVHCDHPVSDIGVFAVKKTPGSVPTHVPLPPADECRRFSPRVSYWKGFKMWPLPSTGTSSLLNIQHLLGPTPHFRDLYSPRQTNETGEKSSAKPYLCSQHETPPLRPSYASAGT